MDSIARLRLGIVLALCAAPLAAQGNLLNNPSFDGDLTGWYDLYSAETTFEHSPVDGNGMPESGSVSITVTGWTHGGTVPIVAQCVVLGPATDYEFFGQAAIPGGQDATGAAAIVAYEYEAEDCEGDILAFHFSGEVTAIDSWEMIPAGSATSTASTGSVRVSLGLNSDGGAGSDTLNALFDNLYFGIAPLFFDGFEEGNTNAWSETHPPPL